MEQATITYGPDPSQFGVLSLPDGLAASLPVVVLVHGGFWRALHGLDLMDGLAVDLVERGFVTWNVEYRRVGQTGGGWPGTLLDVAAAVDELADLATSWPVDLARVAVVGHSAGGHLALWCAGRAELAAGAPGAAPRVEPAMVVGLGPVGDLVAAARDGLGADAVTTLLDGDANQRPERYAVAAPRIASSTRAIVIRGGNDEVVPAAYTVPPGAAAVEALDFPGEDHFDLIDPSSGSWMAVVHRLTTL
jgi:acetyl esterase/lipase